MPELFDPTAKPKRRVRIRIRGEKIAKQLIRLAARKRRTAKTLPAIVTIQPITILQPGPTMAMKI